MKFKWLVKLQREDGNVVDREFEARWSPSKDFITEQSIGVSCAIQENVSTNVKHQPLSATLVKQIEKVTKKGGLELVTG